ncbi:Ig-like domain-containing protein [Pyxidicoccus fallax]|uniref:Ig-like domain-containing protein n=1 Tax=Pyxidicoccus fallax TaxID=394095 RepID=A0A848LH47_9BACT|nr:Ig-like domain-containing protein [Pyxidicoccus fallax]NMO16261.1 Ig-like domain-containing protein [Pyxidicoccus fallax]NPC78668.1 Ig-like domain-containing protein [Pyxidicoccus fallax]
MRFSHSWLLLLLVLAGGCDNPRGLSVTLVTPEDATSTRDTVTVQVTSTGQPEEIELLVDGALLAPLSAPYTYEWDTRALPEGMYVLTARARRARQEAFSLGHRVIVDRTAPQAIQGTPEPGNTNVSVHATLEVRFSEAMRPESFTRETVRLERDGKPVEATWTLEEANTVLKVKPAALTAPAALTLHLDAGLTDPAGNALVLPEQPWTWRVPRLLSVGAPAILGRDARGMALDPAGFPVVARLVDLWPDVQLFRWTGSAWEPLAQRAAGPADYAPGNYRTALRFDGAGQPVLALDQNWGTFHSGFHNALTVQRWTGSAWEPLGPKLVDASLVGLHLDATGAPVMAWTQTVWDGTRWKRMPHVQRWQDGAWSPLGTLDNPVAAFAMGEDGTPVVALVEQPVAPEGTTLQVLRWTGLAWESVAGPVSTGGPTPASRFALELDAVGRPVVAWLEGTTLRLVRLEQGAWTPLAHLEGVNQFDRLRLDTTGAPVVLVGPVEGDAKSLQALRWTGSAWDDLSGVFVGTNYEGAGQLELDAQDRPLVLSGELWVPNL